MTENDILKKKMANLQYNKNIPSSIRVRDSDSFGDKTRVAGLVFNSVAGGTQEPTGTR